MHLDKLMKDRGLSDSQLADRCKCHVSTIEAWRKGENFPRRPQLIKLCEVLRCSSDELIGLGKIPRDPITRMAKRLYQAVTLGGQFNSTGLHQVATLFRQMCAGRPTKIEKWIRGIAEALYEVELVESKTQRIPPTTKKDFTQLRLF